MGVLGTDSDTPVSVPGAEGDEERTRRWNRSSCEGEAESPGSAAARTRGLRGSGLEASREDSPPVDPPSNPSPPLVPGGGGRLRGRVGVLRSALPRPHAISRTHDHGRSRQRSLRHPSRPPSPGSRGERPGEDGSRAGPSQLVRSVGRPPRNPGRRPRPHSLRPPLRGPLSPTLAEEWDSFWCGGKLAERTCGNPRRPGRHHVSASPRGPPENPRVRAVKDRHRNGVSGGGFEPPTPGSLRCQRGRVPLASYESRALPG